MKDVVLAVAAHPDDEVLGCGATLARHAKEGADVHVLILAEGITSRDESRDAVGRSGELDALRGASRRAAAALGARPPVFGGFPDNRMDSVALIDVIKQVERLVEEIRPTVVYTHHPGDLNVDHGIVARAVLTACRPLPGSRVNRICGFEVLSSTEWTPSSLAPPFEPNRWVSVAPFMEAKLSALAAYAGEMRPFPHARSIEAVRALATLRGAQCGEEAAEAFSVLREVVR